MKQRTLAREVSIQGQALHTGETVTLTMDDHYYLGSVEVRRGLHTI